LLLLLLCDNWFRRLAGVLESADSWLALDVPQSTLDAAGYSYWKANDVLALKCLVISMILTLWLHL